MLDSAAEERGSIVAELRRLRAKLAEVSDKDIKAALGQRIEALDRRLAELKAAGPAAADASSESTDADAARAELETELKRLKVKHDAVGDADMQLALAARIEAIKAQLGKIEAEEGPKAPEELPPPPTPEEKEAADKLVQQARVEKMRNNAVGVANLLREASKIAPGSAEVLELLADELAAQGKSDDAIATYDKARKLDPNNVNVDRKHAELVFRSKAAGASALMSMADQEALASSATRAMWFSLMLPGLGQLVLTQYYKGSILMATWLSMLAWLAVGHNQLEGFLHHLESTFGLREGAGETNYSLTIVIPIIVALITHLVAVLGCKSAAREVPFSGPKGKISHPPPPVNLPFE